MRVNYQRLIPRNPSPLQLGCQREKPSLDKATVALMTMIWGLVFQCSVRGVPTFARRGLVTPPSPSYRPHPAQSMQPGSGRPRPHGLVIWRYQYQYRWPRVRRNDVIAHLLPRPLPNTAPCRFPRVRCLASRGSLPEDIVIYRKHGLPQAKFSCGWMDARADVDAAARLMLALGLPWKLQKNPTDQSGQASCVAGWSL
ncbi:hypothetical protein LY76DRAFT_32926 [Colletotrichum caudatum]|nr:hypothetical protein LY76DRAFT_32926 [Colletotrichum caudatum]